jgi:hypothetical protein
MTVRKIVHTPKDQLSVTENYFYDRYALHVSVGNPYGSDMITMTHSLQSVTACKTYFSQGVLLAYCNHKEVLHFNSLNVNFMFRSNAYRHLEHTTENLSTHECNFCNIRKKVINSNPKSCFPKLMVSVLQML